VAVLEYTRLNLDIVHFIITGHLDDFRTFSFTIVKPAHERRQSAASSASGRLS
jgi:hypothetical protein